jgi:hypothetical protein
MAAAIPTSVPSTITAGDTAKWEITLADYDAGTWTLSYALTPFNAGEVITFSASANGSAHRVNVAATTTQLWLAGEYAYQAYVTSGSERFTVATGAIEILPNLVAAGQIDPRTKARRIVDFLEVTMENWSQKQVSRATIEGVSFEFRTWDDLEKAHSFWAVKVSTEEQIASGGSRRCILAQFTTPE